jgi:hypothetical protein
MRPEDGRAGARSGEVRSDDAGTGKDGRVAERTKSGNRGAGKHRRVLVAPHEVLERHGLEVVLVDTRELARVPGRKKTDRVDCKWIGHKRRLGLLILDKLTDHRRSTKAILSGDKSTITALDRATAADRVKMEREENRGRNAPKLSNQKRAGRSRRKAKSPCVTTGADRCTPSPNTLHLTIFSCYSVLE